MKPAMDAIIAQLHERGCRVTKPRIEIITCLSTARRPLTIQEIVERVRADEVSVYRTIELLRDADIVEEIRPLRGARTFALAHGHHHHIVCTGCGKVEHVLCSDVPTVPQSARTTFTTIVAHEVTYYGTCVECA